MTEQSVEAPPAPRLVPLRETGYAHHLPIGTAAGGFWQDLTEETTPDLIWPMSVQVYDRMHRQDAQISSVLRAVTSPILRTAWMLDGTGCDAAITAHVATDLGLPIKGQDPAERAAQPRGRDRFSWNQHLRLALLMLRFGHMYFEQKYRFDDAGRAHLVKLGPRMPKSIARINVARDGGLVSIEQRPAGTAYGIRTTASAASRPLSVDRLVAYVLDREGGNWLGTSLLRPAYKNWLLKDQALEDWSIHINRNGAGVWVYTGPDKATAEDLKKGGDIARAVRAGSEAGADLPFGAKLEGKGITGSVADIDKFVRYQDEQIARAVLAHFLNLGTQTGSWALGSTFADFFTLSLQAVAEEIRDTANRHIVEDIVDLNYGPTVPAPQIVFDEIGSRRPVDDQLTAVRKAAGLEDDDKLADFIDRNVNQEAA